MKLTVLGSGLTVTPAGLPYRYPSAHLVECNGRKVLLDTSIGVLPQTAKLGIEITDIHVICISHYHADHFNLEPLLQAHYILARAAGIKSSLHILGPPGIEERVRTGCKLHGWSFDEDILRSIELTFSPYVSGQAIHAEGGITITPYATKHFTLDAYSLRLAYDRAVLAYSGDSAETEGLEAAAAESDIFLCEAAIDIGKPSDEGHVSARDAGRVANAAKSKKLILVHYSGRNTPDAMREEVEASGFKGQTDIATDLKTYIV